MKKLFVIVFVVAALAVSGSVSADKHQRAELDPMVLVELETSLKTDLIMAELYVTWDIRDNLVVRSTDFIGEQTDVEPAGIIIDDFQIESNWSIAAQD